MRKKGDKSCKNVTGFSFLCADVDHYVCFVNCFQPETGPEPRGASQERPENGR